MLPGLHPLLNPVAGRYCIYKGGMKVLGKRMEGSCLSQHSLMDAKGWDKASVL